VRNRVKGRKHVPLGSKRAGMSLVELLVAMVLLSIGLLGLAMLSMRLIKQHDGAASQQLAALVVQSRFDSLASIRCQNLAPYGTQTGTATTRGITERWAVVDGNDIKTITDTVTFAARKRPLAYVSVIPCRD
jgi:prepilin-type N-terminal cleavage/methylation domain-containing protein